MCRDLKTKSKMPAKINTAMIEMIQTYNAMLIERWIIKAPQKIIPPLRNSESKAPQKILMIRFETKTWLMENQVKLSCFSPVSVHLEIWLQLFWRLLDQNQSRFDTRSSSWSTITLKELWLDKTLRRHAVDWAEFDHLETLYNNCML